MAPWLEVLTILAGGSLIGAFFQYLVDRQRVKQTGEIQDDEAARKLRDELRTDIDQLRTRIEHLEKELENERALRIKEQMDRAKAELSLERYKQFNDYLRQRLSKYEDLPIRATQPAEDEGDTE